MNTVSKSCKHTWLPIILSLAIGSSLCLEGCSSKSHAGKNMDRTAFLLTTPEPLHLFKLDPKTEPKDEALARAFVFHTKMCSYGLPEYATQVVANYTSTLNPESPSYLLLQRRSYDRQFRMCLTLMKTRSTPTPVDNEPVANTSEATENTSQPQNTTASLDSASSQNSTQLSDSTTAAKSPVEESTKPVAKDASSENKQAAQSSEKLKVHAVANISSEGEEEMFSDTDHRRGNSLNRNTIEEYAQAYEKLESAGTFTPEQMLEFADAFFTQNLVEEAEYWTEYFMIVERNNRFAKLELGRHLFSREASKAAGYGIIVDYVRSTGRISRLSILEKNEFVEYRASHPELIAQFERLKAELEDADTSK